MPYMFQKGRDWQLLEWWLSHDSTTRVDRKLKMLEVLGKAGPKQATGVLNLISAGGPIPGGANPPVLNNDLRHLMNDWFGLDELSGNPLPSHTGTGPRYTGSGTAHLGWWKNWHGNARGIFATTLEKAIKVSLGLPSTRALPKTQAARKNLTTECTRDWPIEFQWICPVGWFQAGIAWRQTAYPSAEGDWLPGLVTVTWLTPGNTVPQGQPNATVGLFMNLDQPARSPSPNPNNPDWWGKLGEEPPALQTTGLRGSWIVGQKQTKRILPQQLNKGPSGQWAPAVPSTRSTGAVVTIRPAWWDGGVNPGPPNDNNWTY
jgi:hypothetical protein